MSTRPFGQGAVLNTGQSLREIISKEARSRRVDAEENRRGIREYAMLVPEGNHGVLNLDDFPYQVEPFYSDEIAEALEVAYMKSTQIGACLDPDTRILTADLRWRRMADMRPGDQIVAVDEEPSPPGKGGRRLLQRATVEAVWPVREEAIRIGLADGREMLASLDHRLLARRRCRSDGELIHVPAVVRSNGVTVPAYTKKSRASENPGYRDWAWTHAAELKVGDKLRHIIEPWEELGGSFTEGWLGGIIDGEGCLRARREAGGTELVIVQRVGPVLDRIEQSLRWAGLKTATEIKKNPHGTFVAHVRATRLGEIMRIVGRCRPVRFVDSDWWERRKMPNRDAEAEIVSIEPAGPRELIDLQTSTGTYIAEGLVSHNSTGLWRWVVRQTDQFSETTMYFFPTSTHVTEFGDERIEPSIERSEYLSRRIPRSHTRRKTMKQIGGGILNLRGLESRAGAQAVSAQAIVIDEYDDCDPSNIAQAERRLTGAAAKGHKPRIRRSGRPSLPGFGIDAVYQESDQREWHVICPECGHEQTINFYDNLRWRTANGGDKILRAGHDDYEVSKDILDAWRVCRSCEVSLEGDPIKHGVWKPTKTGPGRIPGYHIPRLIVPLTDLSQIVIASRATRTFDVETFHNADLGVPYAAADAMLTDADLDRAMTHGYAEPFMSYTGRLPITLGVDVASERNLSARVTEHWPDGSRKAIRIWEPTDFEEVAEAMVHFNVTIAAIDAQPERRLAKALARDFPGRVVLVEYEDKPRAPAWHYRPEENTVRVNRTEAIDAMMAGVRDGSNILLREEPHNYRDQMKALKRRTEEDKKGRPRKVYVTTGQHGDDYAHAEVYDLVAKEMLMQIQLAGEMEPEPQQMTPEQAPPRLGYGVTQYQPGFQDRGEY